MATRLLVEALSKRRHSEVFRGRDDLDSFTGAIWRDVPTGPVLVMRHDNNPQQITAFYVDSAKDVANAQRELVAFFGLANSEVAWVLKQGDL